MELQNTRNRRSIRLKGYDYAKEGSYFVTICTQDRKCLFGEIVNGEVALNEIGKIVYEEWLNTPILRPYVTCCAFVVMPNHFHGILTIEDGGTGTAMGTETATGMETAMGTGTARHAPTETTTETTTGMETAMGRGTARRAPTETTRRAPTVERFGQPVPGSIPTIVRSFKSAVTKRINESQKTHSLKIWQRNYYEHIIRDQNDWNRICAYIENNPLRWELDSLNPTNGKQNG